MEGFFMKNLTKKIGGMVITGAMVVTSISSAFAATNITRVNTIDINNSYAGAVVAQSDNIIKANGRDINITGISGKTIKDSVLETGVFTGSSTINANGKNVDIISADTITIDGSYVETLVNDIKGKIKTRSR